MAHNYLMKKKTINALSAVIILILLGTIVLPAVMFIISIFVTSYCSSNSHSGDILQSNVPVEINLHPSEKEFLNPSFTLTFDNQETYPMSIYDVVIMMPTDRAVSDFVWPIAVSVLLFLCFTLLMIDFIKFIININKGIIFEQKNLRYLNRFGWLLILTGIFECISDLLHDNYIQKLNLSLKGYTISYDSIVPWDIFLLGFLALLLARVWKCGMSIEEERKLTI